MNNFKWAIDLIYKSELRINVVLLLLISFSIIILVLYIEIKYKFTNNNLNDRDDLLHTLCSSIDDIVIIYDSVKHRFEYISPNFENILGFNSKTLDLNKNAIWDYVSPEKKEEYIELFNSSKLTYFKELEFEYQHPTYHQLRWLGIRFYPVMKNNEIIRYITCIKEKTEECYAQASIKEALETSRKANEAKKEFLSHISHEIKTPINNILGITKIAMDSISNTDKVMYCLKKIHFSSNNLLTLINNILDMAKLDSDKLILINEPFYMQKAINEFSSVISFLAEIKNVEFKLIIHPSVHDYVVGDSLRITQILGNCLSNSIKFTPSGGMVTLDIRELEYTSKNSLYRFQITDNGKGMEEDYINHIFEPFDQENHTIGTEYGGSGLGMTITKTLLDLMGGTIQVNSKVGEGTDITIDILLMVAISPGSKNKEHSPIPKVEYDFTGMRILVVEDNEINLEIVTEYLKNVNIYVETAANGHIAIELFKASEEGYYNMILMDIHMPDLSGYEASRLIRSSNHPDAGQIAIIAMTADNFVNDFSCIQSGINYHISKPIDLNKLYSLLNSIWQPEG